MHTSKHIALKRIIFFSSIFIALCAGRLLAQDYVSVVTNTPNLLGYWRFDPVFQTNSIVNGYTGTLEGNAMIGPPSSGCPLPMDPTNQALLLDGSTAYLTTSLYGGITNEGSVMTWVNLAAEPSQLGHFFQISGQSQDGDDFDFQIETDNHVYFFTDDGSATVYDEMLPTNQWHFLAATFVANTARAIYLDGVQVTNSIPGGHSLNTSHPFSIGENLVFTGRYFDGKECEVAVFSRALSASEIAAIYAASRQPFLALNLASQPGAAVLSWPTNFAGYTIQTNASLSNPSGWSDLNGSSGILGTNFVVTNTISSPQLFFRLTQ